MNLLHYLRLNLLGKAFVGMLSITVTAVPAGAQFASGGGSTIGGPVGSTTNTSVSAMSTTSGATSIGNGGGGGGGGNTGTSGSSSLIMGGSANGTATVGTNGGGGTTTTIASPISQAGPFSGYYASPTAAGQSAYVTLQPSEAQAIATTTIGTTASTAGSTTPAGATNTLNAIVTGKGTFGIPQYSNLYLVTPATTTGTNTQSSTGFNSLATKRTPQYTMNVNFKVPPSPTLETLRNTLQAALQQSSSLPTAKDLAVTLDGQTFVLKGTVATERERRVAEGVVLLTPGVSTVRNEIRVVSNK
jgi:hypothetical protein